MADVIGLFLHVRFNPQPPLPTICAELLLRGLVETIGQQLMKVFRPVLGCAFPAVFSF